MATKEEKLKKERRKALLQSLAVFLTEELAVKSIELGLNRSYARRWSEMYQCCGLSGYAKLEDAQKALEELFGEG